MKKSETQWSLAMGVVLQFLLGSSFALGQVVGETRTIEITVDDPRPLAAAILKLEELSGIPINYEDMPVYYSDDMRDVTDEVAQRPVPPGGKRMFGQSGGQLSVPIEVDAATGKLIDLEAVNTALAALVSAYNASDLPGDFDMEGRNGVFFVMPVRYRDATGTTQPMTPILSTPITLPEERRGWIQTIRLILGQVSAATGVEIGPNILKSGMCDRRSTKRTRVPPHRPNVGPRKRHRTCRCEFQLGFQLLLPLFLPARIWVCAQ